MVNGSVSEVSTHYTFWVALDSIFNRLEFDFSLMSIEDKNKKMSYHVGGSTK